MFNRCEVVFCTVIENINANYTFDVLSIILLAPAIERTDFNLCTIEDDRMIFEKCKI